MGEETPDLLPVSLLSAGIPHHALKTMLMKSDTLPTLKQALLPQGPMLSPRPTGACASSAFLCSLKDWRCSPVICSDLQQSLSGDALLTLLR